MEEIRWLSLRWGKVGIWVGWRKCRDFWRGKEFTEKFHWGRRDFGFQIKISCIFVDFSTIRTPGYWFRRRRLLIGFWNNSIFFLPWDLGKGYNFSHIIDIFLSVQNTIRFPPRIFRSASKPPPCHSCTHPSNLSSSRWPVCAGQPVRNWKQFSCNSSRCRPWNRFPGVAISGGRTRTS